MRRSRHAFLADFPSIEWVKVDGGGAQGRMKRLPAGESGIRILELSPKWNEEDWCKRGHIGFVVSGKVLLEFRHQEAIYAGRGQGFSIPEGCAHRATCKGVTRIFMVD